MSKKIDIDCYDLKNCPDGDCDNCSISPAGAKWEEPTEQMTKEKTIWDIPDVGKLVAGIKTQLMKCSPNDTVVHVQFPKDVPADRSAKFAERLRKEFPSKVRMAFTTPDVKLNISRPKEINLLIRNCEISKNELNKQILQLLRETADIVNITLDHVKLVNTI